MENKNLNSRLLLIAYNIKNSFSLSECNKFPEKFITVKQPEDICIKPLYVNIFKFQDKKIKLILTSSNTKKHLLFNKKEFYEKLYKSNKNYYFYTTLNKKLSKKPIRVIVIFVKKKNSKFIIEAATEVNSLRKESKDIFAIFYISTIILFIILSFSGYFFIKNTLRPVRKIIKNVRKILKNDLFFLYNNNNERDEIKDLFNTFNELIIELRKKISQLRNFTSDIAHDLKTPIAVIKGEIDVILRKPRKCSEYKNVLISISEEADNIQHIISTLLFMTRIDNKTINVKFQRISLTEVLLKVFERFVKISKSKKVKIILKKIDEIYINGSPVLLDILFSNLLDNAIKYNIPNGKIEINLIKINNKYKFVVSDTGIGIPQKDIPYIFDRFYKVDKSRKRGSNLRSSGLGLSIAKWIIDIHNGKIKVISKVKKGSKFIVEFPID